MANVWINEFHYDNASTDVGEFIEIAGRAGMDLTGWQIVAYNGFNGLPYASITLSDAITDMTGTGYGFLSFTPSQFMPIGGTSPVAFQNGGSTSSPEPDGFALIDHTGKVVEFISYEGTDGFTAVSGPAAGMKSTRIGAIEDGSSSNIAGGSIQRSGATSGSEAGEFDTWTAVSGAGTATSGAANTNQIFEALTNDFVISAIGTQVEGDGTNTITFKVTRSNPNGTVSVDWALNAPGGAGRASVDDFEGINQGTLTFAEGVPTQEITLTLASDTDYEISELFSINLSNPTNGATISSGTASSVIVDDDPVPIYEIQGKGHTSSYANKDPVTTQGVITGIQMTGPTRGFYIQDVNGDGDATTSDAIFVFRGSNWTPNVEVGDMVSVTGGIAEYRPTDSKALTLTQFGTSATVSVLSKNHELPDAVVIGPNGIKPPTGDVQAAKAFYEALEGMRVTVESTRVVGATNNFGEIFTVVEGAYDPSSLNSRGGLSISDGDFNPERIQFDNIRDSLNMPMVDVGARLAAQTGIMSYGFGSYEVLIDTTPVVTAQSTLQAEQTNVTAWNEFFLSFGNYNVENLDINDNDGDADVDGGQFAKLAEQIVKNMGSPHVLALQELQDDSGTVDNGVLSADKTLQKLVDEIVKAGGPRYEFAYLDPEDGKDGGAPGGNIRQAFLYNADAGVELVGALERINDPDPNPATNAFTASRKPLVATFRFNGEEYTFINNHLNSKGGDEPIFGEHNTPDLVTEVQRIKQAQLINDYVDGLLSTGSKGPNANIVVLGDLNDFAWSNPLKTLDGTINNGSQILWNMAEDFIADPRDRTDYVYEGNSQSLDHIYVSSAMRARMEAMDIVRINSEFDVGQRASDHDALVARSTFRVTRAIEGNPEVIGDGGSNALIGNGSDNVMRGAGGRDYLQGDGGNDMLIGGEGADGLYGGDGIDWVSYLGATSGVIANLDAPLDNTGEAAGDTYNSVENILGSTFADALTGNAADNVIDGAGGTDRLQGNGGNDTYMVENALDTVIEAAGGGTDTIRTSVSYTLAVDAEVELLTAVGSDAINLTGNAFANTITGTAAANAIDGGAGADRMIGDNGDDTYIVDNAGDVVIETANGGTDTITTSVSFVLGSSLDVERLTATGSAGVSLTGNALLNAITGNAGANKLYGGLGNDQLRGGLGKDTFVFDTKLNKSANVDRILDFSVRDDSIHLDNKIFTKLGSGSASNPKKFTSDMFVKGTKAKDREDRIVYDSKTGALYYDADGTGSKAQVKIATLNKSLGLTHSDFFVI